MKYSIITQKCNCHLFVEALLRSVEKHLSPDEIIVVSDTNTSLGELMHKEILKVRNDYFLMLDQDIMMFDNSFVEEMYRHAEEPNVMACGAIDLNWNQFGYSKILVASCNMVNRKMYLDNGVPFHASEPCLGTWEEAMRRKQKFIKVGSNSDTVSTHPAVFHMNQAFKTIYSDVVIVGWWKRIFNVWKNVTGSKEVFEDYFVDDGADYLDQIQMSNYVVWAVKYGSEVKRDISVLRLEDEGVQFLMDYYAGKQVDKKLAEELISYVQTATWLDHSYLFKGCFNVLFDAQSVQSYFEAYKKMMVTTVMTDTYSGRYCIPLQNYMFFIKDSNVNFHAMVSNRKVRYAGPYDAMGELNKKKDLQLSKYEYCQISNEKDSIDKFFENYNVKDWDIVFVSSNSIYANIIVGRVKKLGGVAVNIGEAIFFNPSDKIKQVLTVAEDGISYIIKDGYPNYGKRLFEKYLIGN